MRFAQLAVATLVSLVVVADAFGESDSPPRWRPTPAQLDRYLAFANAEVTLELEFIKKVRELVARAQAGAGVPEDQVDAESRALENAKIARLAKLRQKARLTKDETNVLRTAVDEVWSARNLYAIAGGDIRLNQLLATEAQNRSRFMREAWKSDIAHLERLKRIRDTLADVRARYGDAFVNAFLNREAQVNRLNDRKNELLKAFVGAL